MPKRDAGITENAALRFLLYLASIFSSVVTTLCHVSHDDVIHRIHQEQRSVIRFPWSEGVRSIEMNGKIIGQYQYSDNSTSQKSLQIGRKLRRGLTNVNERS
jgi:hypothetical protein